MIAPCGRSSSAALCSASLASALGRAACKLQQVWWLVNGPPATGGGGPGPPLGLDFKLPKNGFSEAPQTSQVPRMYLWANFGQKILWPHHPPRTYWPLKKGSVLQKTANFPFTNSFLRFYIDKMRFLVRKVSFRLLLVLETLDQPKLAVWNQNFLRSLIMISERSTSVCKIFDVTHKKQVSRYRCSCTTRVKFWY